MDEQRAIIDIGSNTVRLVIYGGPPRSPAVLLNEKVTPKLGKDVARDGMLSEKSMEVALTALKRYATLLDLKSIENVEAVATAAVRDAKNGGEFLQEIGKLGITPRMLSGEEEACASAMGVVAAFPGAKGIAGDLGGGSLELTTIDGEDCGGAVTLPFGTLRLPDLRRDGAERFAKSIRRGLKEARWTSGRDLPFFIVGGSWRALALHAMHRMDWPLDDPHDFELSPEQAMRICTELSEGEMVATAPRISSSRLASLPDAAALLGVLTEAIGPSRIVFSSWGLREGLLYSQLDDETRALDPMLEGVQTFAASFGVEIEIARKVADWTAGICGESNNSDEKLRLAATMLALAAMRNEPNMRADQAKGWALRKRWIGLDARGRAMIAMAVLANSAIMQPPAKFTRLASEDDLDTAICWGLAVRLCRRLTDCSTAALEQTSILRENGRLILRLDEPSHALLSNGPVKDMRLLAEWHGLDWKAEYLSGEKAG